MPIGPARMPVSEHLGEMRRRIIICLVTIFLMTCVVYVASPIIIDFLKAPVEQYMPDEGELYVMTPMGGFMVKFKVSLFIAFIASMPMLIWQFMAFLLPALRPNERRWFVPTFAVSVLLYVGGMAFCYYLILSPAFQWMYGETGTFATVLADAERFIRLILLFEIGFGLAFQLPLVVFYLVYFGIISYARLRHAWRYIYVALMVIAACITPDANPVPMLLLFLAMIALYELSLLVARIALRNKIKRQKAEGTYLDEDGQLEEILFKKEKAAEAAKAAIQMEDGR